MAGDLLTVKVVGLGETIDAFEAGRREFPSLITEAQRKVAMMIVPLARAGAAVVRTSGAGTPVRAGSANAATIRMSPGPPVTVEYGGLISSMGHEFGSYFYRQFPPFTGTTGYFFYPAIRATKDEAFALYQQAAVAAFVRNGPAI